MINNYPWLQSVWQKLEQSLVANRLPHALLFQENANLGVAHLIKHFSRVLLCQNSTTEACGFCHSCQLSDGENHPDIHYIRPEKEGKSINVEQIRQCNRLAQESSQFNGYRLFIIEHAELMNESASNALLKTLEEPGQKCVFILQTQHSERLLATINSRCQTWNITTPSITDARNWLNLQGASDIKPFVLKLCQFSPLAALEFIQNKELKNYQSFEKELLTVLNSPIADLTPVTQFWVKNPEQVFHWCWYLLTDCQKYLLGIRDESLLPGASKFISTNYHAVHQVTQQLQALKLQIQQFSGLNIELLASHWLIESREALCS